MRSVSRKGSVDDVSIDAFRLTDSLFDLAAGGAIDYSSHQSVPSGKHASRVKRKATIATLGYGQDSFEDMNRLRLKGPTALVGKNMLSAVDSVMFCVPAPLLSTQSSTAHSHKSISSDRGNDVTDSSVAMSHNFPCLLIDAATSDETKVERRLKRLVHDMVKKCASSTDITDGCWDTIFDPQVLLYLYTYTESQLMSSFVKTYSDMRNNLSRTPTSLRSFNSRISIELNMLLTSIKMYLEILADDFDTG